ncbi:MAG TPA: hypothetical protein VGM92_03025 [Candidatus Kapabacteria bacterium]|jgi:hypothetical protein
MNWKLIVLLPLIGLAMGLLTVSIIPSKIEPIFWLAIFVFIAYVITGSVPKGKYFAHAWFVSLISGVFIGCTHAIFHDAYIANHADEVKQMAGWPGGESPLAMVAFGPLFGAIFGLVSGCISMFVGKLRKPKVRQAVS